MYCEHCGTELTDDSKCCSQCGQAHSSERQPPLPVKPKRRWLKWTLGIAALLLAGVYWIGSTVVLPQNIIVQQLVSLKERQLTEAYYDYTSKDFQKTISLDSFKKYIKTNPVLQNPKSFLVEDEALQGSISTIRGYIIAEDGSSLEAIYKLIFEDERWKILSISPVERNVQEEIPQTSMTKEMLEPVKSFLSEIQKPDFNNVYPTLVTKSFLENTPYTEFQKFAVKNPILTSFTDYEIVDHQLIRGRGELYVMLNPEHDEIPAAFTVIKENGSWKIFRASLGSPKEIEALQTKELFETVLIPFVKNSITHLKNNDFERFHQESTSKSFQSDVDVALLQQLVQEYPLMSQFTDLRARERGEAGDLVWIDMELKKGSDSWVVEFTLGKDPDQWKILGMKMFELDSIQ
jgi:hypothetical protein